MARLPKPGGDSGDWGDILNDYLRQVHEADGSLKSDTVGAPQLKSGAVTKAMVGLSDVDNTADSAKPVSSPQQTALDLKLDTQDLDSEVAAQVADETSETAVALSATIETVGEGLFTPAFRKPRVAVLGESHAGGASANSPIAHSPTEPMSWAQLLGPTVLGGNNTVQYVWNAGVGTTSIADALTRTSAVLAADPDVVWHIGGTYESDPARSISLATYKAGIIALRDAYVPLGIHLVLTTCYPSISSGARRQRIEKQNNWLRAWAATQSGISLVDAYAVMIDPATGANLTALRDTSGVHANGAGNKLIGLEFLRVIRDKVAAWAPPLAGHATADSPNMMQNALFLVDSGGDGKPEPWVESAAFVASLVSGDPAIKGNWFRAVDVTSGLDFISHNSGSLVGAYSAGDRIAVCGRFSLVRGTSTKTVTVQLSFASGTPNSIRPVSAWDTDVTNGVFYAEDTVPAGTTGLSAALLRNSGGTQGSDDYTVTINGGPTGGTFTLTFAGQTTSAIAYNADAATVQAALQALSTVTNGTATVTGSTGGPYTVKFKGGTSGRNVDSLTANAAGLTGGSSPTVVPVMTGIRGYAQIAQFTVLNLTTGNALDLL